MQAEHRYTANPLTKERILRVKLAAYIATGAYALAFLIYGITLPSSLARILAFVPTVIVVMFAIFDSWLWRFLIVPSVIRQPVLIGTWRGTLRSYRRDERGQRVESDHDIFIIIRQNYSDISLTMVSRESKSYSGAAQIIRRRNEEFIIQYQYQNEPRLEFRERGSTIHIGGSTIEVGSVRPIELDGEYWTARETRGTYHLSKVSTKRVSSYAEALRLAGG